MNKSDLRQAVNWGLKFDVEVDSIASTHDKYVVRVNMKGDQMTYIEPFIETSRGKQRIFKTLDSVVSYFEDFKIPVIKVNL